MATNSGQIGLGKETFLFDGENEIMGFNSSRSNVSVGVSFSETMISDVGETNVVGFNHVNLGCDVMINVGGKEGFIQEKFNGLEDGGMLDGFDGGCDWKVGKFSCGSVMNEDGKSEIQCSDGSDKGLVFGLNDGVQIEQEFENVEKGGLSNEVRGVEGEVTERGNEAKNIALVNSSAVVVDGGVINGVDSFVIKDDYTDSRALEDATYQLQDGIPYVEDMDVNVEESLDAKDSFSRNCHELYSNELKQPDFVSDAQVNVIQKHTTDINISGAGQFKNIQYDCHGFDLVVDLNSCKNTQEGSVSRESVFSKGNYCVSDLVWGKVRGHPWWPGQIYDPSVASEEAKSHRKENCYLIAYFGDQTFGWNDVSKIKPFHKHFPEMEKQSDWENFRHAVDCALEEASRRVEFGLSCPCMGEEASSRLKVQVIANGATSFESMELINYVKSLAQSPLIECDRLDFASARAQLSAYYRTKGFSQLPEFAMLGQLFETDMEILPLREKEECGVQINEQVLETDQGFSQKSKDISHNTKKSGKKNKLLSDLMSEKISCSPNGEHLLEKKAGDNSTSRRGRKRKSAYDTDDYFHDPQIAVEKPASRRGRKRKTIFNSSDECSNNSQTGNLTQLQNVSIDEMQSQLCLAANDPAGESCFSDMIHFFAEFKKFTGRNDFVFLEQGLSLEQNHSGKTGVITSTEGGEAGVITSIEAGATASMSTPMEICNDYLEQNHGGETGVITSTEGGKTGVITSIEAAATASMSTPMEICNDSYWTDRIIQSVSEEETLLKNQNEREELLKNQNEREELLPAAKIIPNLSTMHQNTDENLGSEPTNHVENVDESSPTALTLKFTSLDSVPSTTNLNKIFGRYGPLIESKTELLERTNRARVVFKRRCDAETAFSSAGKYSIFGPSLQSYRLKILPPPPPKKGTGKRGRKSKKEKSSMDTAAV